MDTVVSRDGTRIAYDAQGDGPVVILVAGALCSRLGWSGPGLSERLSTRFTVINYDRRGRGDSGDTPPYAVEREIEDIEALIDRAGGKADLYGHSSGASLVLEAAVRLDGKVGKIALYEAPYNDEPAARTAFSAYNAELATLLAAGRKGDAVALFMKYVGVPAEHIAGARSSPGWAGMEAIAPTLVYDHTGVMGGDGAIPAQRAAAVTATALVMAGSASYPFMMVTAERLSRIIPRARLRLLDGQRHDVSLDAITPVLEEFFGAS
jgi:pimeloyl-ACP methyl ester carboxylesterase